MCEGVAEEVAEAIKMCCTGNIVCGAHFDVLLRNSRDTKFDVGWPENQLQRRQKCSDLRRGIFLQIIFKGLKIQRL